MTRRLTVLDCGPAVSVQDPGRPGWLGIGLARGGAMDRLALAEGAALLGQPPDTAALECAGMGGRFTVSGGPVRLALTGAEMPLTIDGDPVPHATTATAPEGAVIDVGGARAGVYGYLHVDGGIATPPELGARARHASVGLGQPIRAGTDLPLGPLRPGEDGLTLPLSPRFGGGTLRVIASYQTKVFAPETRERLARTPLRRGAAGNRMGIQLDGGHFAAQGGLQILSDIITPGDIQMTGDGLPFVLMADCQTTGGYPRIGTVLACDMPRLAQAEPGAPLRLTWVGREAARAALRADQLHRDGLPGARHPRLRDPRQMADLLSYTLISGAITGWDDDTP